MSAPGDVDQAWLLDVLLLLLATDTAVPSGASEVAAGDPRILSAVLEVWLPLLESLHPEEVRQHPAGDVAVRFGPARDDGLLVQTYVVTQHGNRAAEPRLLPAGRGEDGRWRSGHVAVGPGASQHRGATAAAFAALRRRPTALRRPVWLAVNTEGRSSHDGSRRVLHDLGVRAAHAVLAVGTDLMISRANRGRVDVVVTAEGQAHHSSREGQGPSSVEVAADVVVALRDLPVPPPDPELGRALVTPYRVTTEPVAPHTVPARVEVTVDHRLLPGSAPEEAVNAVREHLVDRHGLPVVVDVGPWMLPAVVHRDAPVVHGLADGLAAAGRPVAVGVSTATFDAGYGCAQGIPTCMFGPGRRAFTNDITADEHVALADCEAGAAVLAHAVGALCT